MTTSSQPSSSELVRKEACPNCDSSDALAVYDDGHAHCFSCDKTIQDSESDATPREFESAPPLASDMIRGITLRAHRQAWITEAVCRSHGFGMATFGGRQFRSPTTATSPARWSGQKVKGRPEGVLGPREPEEGGLWQQHRWPKGRRNLLICEGETTFWHGKRSVVIAFLQCRFPREPQMQPRIVASRSSIWSPSSELSSASTPTSLAGRQPRKLAAPDSWEGLHHEAA